MALVVFVLGAAFTPLPLQCRSTPHSHAVALRSEPRMVLGAGAVRSAFRRAVPNRPLPLGAKATLSTVATVLCTSARALAAPSSATAAPFTISGDVVKWGALCGVFGVAFAFKTPETPILVETPMPAEPEASAASSADAAAAPPAELPTEVPQDDGALASALQQRMLQLAQEAAAADAEPAPDADEPPADSSDGWGQGSTAVLEPPMPPADAPSGGLLADGPAVDFPEGFPLRDGEAVEKQEEEEEELPLADEASIAMLERMFGTRSD